MSDNLIFPEPPGGPSPEPELGADDALGSFLTTFGAADGPLDESFAGAAEAGPGDGAAPAAEAKPAKRARGKESLVLGVHVTADRVNGVLVRATGETYEPLRQFVRNRAESQFGSTIGGALSPDEVGSSDEPAFASDAADVTVQFGGVGEIDFSAEFAGMGVTTDAAFEAPSTTGEVEAKAQPIVFELRDILEECAEAGFAPPALAFAVDAPDVVYAEVSVPPEKKGKKAPKKGKDQKDGPAAPAADGAEPAPVKRERLVELLPDVGVRYDKDRAVFLPMTPRDGLARYLAVAPAASEPVAESLEMLREQGAYRKVAYRTLEAEVPLLVGLVRQTLKPEPGENTAVVRVGAEDTVVLLLSGGRIQHYEQMQSVTAFDGPDTVCSRVLLQQDVQGVGTVHNVVVVSEEREKELVQGFAAFYPEARVETLREGMARQGLVGPYGPLAPAVVEAAGAAVAGHLAGVRGGPFEDTNLLPARLLRRRPKLALSFEWHTLVAAVLLVMSGLYFTSLYVSQKNEIADAERRLAEYPPEARMSAPQLQARIDSLHERQASLTASLVALDSLLVDSDRWTQTLLRTTRAAAQTGGVWIEEWEPDGHDISIHGYATTRGTVVGLAARLDATIEEVSFEDIREYAVYSYRMRFTQPPELPQITRVMREQVGEAAAVPADPFAALGGPVPGGLASGSRPAPPASGTPEI